MRQFDDESFWERMAKQIRGGYVPEDPVKGTRAWLTAQGAAGQPAEQPAEPSYVPEDPVRGTQAWVMAQRPEDPVRGTEAWAMAQGAAGQPAGEVTPPSTATPGIVASGVPAGSGVPASPGASEASGRLRVSGTTFPSYAEAVEEWDRTGRPVLSALQEYYPAPTPEISEEQARRMRTAAALGESLKLLGELYGDSRNATIRDRYAEKTEADKANAEIDAANARYRQLLDAYNKMTASVAMEELDRIHSGKAATWEMEQRQKQAEAQARQKAEQERQALEDKKGYEQWKYDTIDKPKAAQAQKDRMEQIGAQQKGARELENQRHRNAVALRGMGGGSGSGKSSKYVTVTPDGKYKLRLEESKKPFVVNGEEYYDPEMQEREYLTEKTRDVVITPEEYALLEQNAKEAVGQLAAYMAGLGTQLSSGERRFLERVKGAPERLQKDDDYLTKVYIQSLYETGEYALPEEARSARRALEAGKKALGVSDASKTIGWLEGGS